MARAQRIEELEYAYRAVHSENAVRGQHLEKLTDAFRALQGDRGEIERERDVIKFENTAREHRIEKLEDGSRALEREFMARGQRIEKLGKVFRPQEDMVDWHSRMGVLDDISKNEFIELFDSAWYVDRYPE